MKRFFQNVFIGMAAGAEFALACIARGFFVTLGVVLCIMVFSK
jgi:hypothetical protein